MQFPQKILGTTCYEVQHIITGLCIIFYGIVAHHGIKYVTLKSVKCKYESCTLKLYGNIVID